MHWILMELARNPEFQQRLKEEIRAKNVKDWKATDLDSLPFMNAFLKAGIEHESGRLF